MSGGAGSKEVILCLNSGSSSLKFALYEVDNDEPRASSVGAVDGIGTANGQVWLHRVDRAGFLDSSGSENTNRTSRPLPRADHDSALEAALDIIDTAGHIPTIVGHRVVHGGGRHIHPTRIDSTLLKSLEELVPLAPLHMPLALAGIRIVSRRSPGRPQIACFDTSFHHSLPERARRLPLPESFDREGVRRYGFHGLSYEYVMSTFGSTPPSRVIIAHLGNGASLVAVKDGSAIDTTMGFTPIGGILMGTRSGDLDPGVIVHLLRRHGLSVDDLERMVDRESGLAAIAGTSDMQTLLHRASFDARAKLAIEMFTYGVRKAVGSLAGTLGGIDELVFTGGIGEHSAEIRFGACNCLAFMGIRIDVERNRRGADVISDSASSCRVSIVKTDETLVIARHALALSRHSTST